MTRKDIEELLAGAGELTPARAGREETAASVLGDVLAGLETGLTRGLGQFTGELEQLRVSTQTQAATVAENTQTVLKNTVAQASAGGTSTLTGVGRALWNVFGSGLGMAPLISGLVRLFAGGQEETPAPLVAYTPPSPVEIYGQVSRSATGESYAWEYEGRGGGQVVQPASAAPATQITVQVQAMDSRSFLDHSDEIARAVREAMLNSHALNDVVSEL